MVPDRYWKSIVFYSGVQYEWMNEEILMSCHAATGGQFWPMRQLQKLLTKFLKKDSAALVHKRDKNGWKVGNLWTWVFHVNKYGSNLSTAEILSAGKLRGMKHTLSMFWPYSTTAKKIVSYLPTAHLWRWLRATPGLGSTAATSRRSGGRVDAQTGLPPLSLDGRLPCYTGDGSPCTPSTFKDKAEYDPLIMHLSMICPTLPSWGQLRG